MYLLFRYLLEGIFTQMIVLGTPQLSRSTGQGQIDHLFFCNLEQQNTLERVREVFYKCAQRIL